MPEMFQTGYAEKLGLPKIQYIKKAKPRPRFCAEEEIRTPTPVTGATTSK